MENNKEKKKIVEIAQNCGNTTEATTHYSKQFIKTKRIQINERTLLGCLVFFFLFSFTPFPPPPPPPSFADLLL